MLVCKDGVIEECPERLPEAGEVVWIHLTDPDEATIHALLAEMYGLHPLAIEDVLHFGQRPKIDVYPALDRPHALISFYTINFDLTVAEFCALYGEQFLITVEKKPVTLFSDVRKVAEANPKLLRSPQSLLHKLLDRAVDEYLEVVDALETHIDRTQERVFAHPETPIASEIFRLQRRLHRARKVCADARTVMSLLLKDDALYAEARLSAYYADVYDHVARALDQMEGVRDSLGALLDLQSSQRAMRMNEVMRTLTVIATIFLPLTFIVGLYGMNFHDIPELGWQYGYAYVWALMIAVTLGMLYYFKRKGWW